MQKLFKVERYAFDFVLADNSSQAKDFDFDNSDPTKTVTEITEMSPEREAFKRNPYDLKTCLWLNETCGEWLQRTATDRLREKESEQLARSALSKLSSAEYTAVLEWASKQPRA